MGSLPSDANLENCAAQTPERRQALRIRCRLPVEICTKGSRFATRGETTDVSVGGCYVGSMQPMATGTEVEFRCWVGDRAIECKAVVRTCDPCVGNGMEFLGLDLLSQAILGAHLEKVQKEDESASEPGVIHGRM